MVTAVGVNHQITQNSSFFKHVQQEVIQPENTVESADDRQTLIGNPYRMDSAEPTTPIQRNATCQQSQP